MKILLTTVFMLTLTHSVAAQNWDTVLSLDSRAGYSTNTYLNTYIGEWNPQPGSYNLTSAIGSTYWSRHKISASATGGLYYQPTFSDANANWKGTLGLARMNYRLTGSLSAGMEGGATLTDGPYRRTNYWLQPTFRWFVTPFTSLKLKAGSSGQQYQNVPDTEDTQRRYDLYSMELEHWPTYRWRLKAGLYGNLDTFPAIQEGFNTRFSAGYHFYKGATISLQAGLRQYQFSETITDGGGGGGFPGGSPTDTETTVNGTDRVFHFGVDASMPLNNRISVFTKAEGMLLKQESTEASRNDYQASAGFRINFEPKLKKSRETTVEPEWEIERERQQITLRYTGDAQLYIVGSFNDWEKPGVRLVQQSDDIHVAELNLSEGAHEYKILKVEGSSEEWLEFSDQTYTVSDGFDSKNAMIFVDNN